MRIWVNFAELRTKLSSRFEDVLRHYKVEVVRKGSQHQGFCPLPGHTGKRKSPSFSANLERGIFKCFGCGAEGNVLEFACLMAGVDPEDGDGLRSVAVELQQKFFPEGTGRRAKPREEPAPTAGSLPVKVNAPLDFELKDLDPGHAYLASTRKFARETMVHFGVGFCSRGLLKDKIAIPLHDNAGHLLGYAGRVIDDLTVTDENPKYRLPSRRERGGVIYELRKSLFVYNAHRLKPRSEPLIVVEGFPSVWWLTQHGFGRVVSTMGSECSDEQADAIVRLQPSDAPIWLMPDGDKAGERFAQALLLQLSPHRYVRWARLSDGHQPTDLTAHDLKSVLSE